MFELWIKICATSAVIVAVDLLISLGTDECDPEWVSDWEAYVGVAGIAICVVSLVCAIWTK